MKATIDFDENMYRRLKMEAARRGTTIKELVAEGVRRVLDGPAVVREEAGVPSWFGSLRGYAKNAKGAHDMASVRESIVRGRRGERA